MKPFALRNMGVGALLCVSLIVPGTAAFADTSVNTQTNISSSTNSKKVLTFSSLYPFGNGKSDQKISYGKKVADYNWKVTNATSETKVQIYKYNTKTKKANLYKELSKATYVNGATRTYRISVPTPAEGDYAYYYAKIAATSTHGQWSGNYALIQTSSRLTVGIIDTISPYYNSSTSAKVSARNGAKVTMSGFRKESGAFYLQEKVNGKWKSIAKTSRKNIANKKLQIGYTIPGRAAGKKAQFRLHHPATSTVKSWTTKVFTANYVAEKSSVSSSVWNDFDKTWATNAKVKLHYVYVGNGDGRTAYVQKYNSKKKKWISVASGKIAKNNYAKLTVPANKTATTERFRVHVPKNTRVAATSSKTKTVKYIEPKKYTGYKKKAFNYQKKYCPSVIINTAKPNKKWLGHAFFYKPEMTLVTGMKSDQLKFVALHECAHILQGKVYETDIDALKRVGNKYYGNSKSAAGFERMADCMAHVMGGSPRYYGYMKKCSSKQLSIARQIVHGKKLMK